MTRAHANTKEQEDYELVYFDLATTSVEKTVKIIHIAACTKNGYKFNAYIYPVGGQIHECTTKANGFKIKDKYLYINKERLYTIKYKKAIIEFLLYLESFEKKVILVSHGSYFFDTPVILRCIRWMRLIKRFKRAVHGFADTLPIIKRHFMVTREKYKSFKLQDLAEKYLSRHKKYSIDSAKDANKMLKEILENININENEIKTITKSTNAMLKTIYKK